MIETRNDNFPSKVYFWNTDTPYFFMKREYFFSLQEKILIETYLEDCHCPPYCMNEQCMLATIFVELTGSHSNKWRHFLFFYRKWKYNVPWCIGALRASCERRQLSIFCFCCPSSFFFIATNASRYSHFSGLCRLLFKCSSFGVDCKVRKSAVLLLCSLSWVFHVGKMKMALRSRAFLEACYY